MAEAMVEQISDILPMVPPIAPCAFQRIFGLAIGFGRNAGTGAGLVQAGADDWSLVASQDRKTAE
jgi:hypothetical protein